MQFLMLVKSADTSGTPPESLFTAMDAYVARGVASGMVINTGGLAPVTDAVEVRNRSGKMSVVDGPFAETKEVIGGYAIINADSREHAIELSREFMQLHIDHWPEWNGTSEVREIAAMFQP